jgi:hypothetical protein
MLLILLIILIFLTIGGAPYWGYHNYGYAPSSLGLVIVVVLVVLLLMGRL